MGYIPNSIWAQPFWTNGKTSESGIHLDQMGFSLIPGKNDPSPHISKAQSWALSQSREERGPLEQGNIRGGIPLRRWPCT